MLTEELTKGENLNIRKFHPRAGRFPPSARFTVYSSGYVRVHFNLETIVRYGVGTEFRSADLFYITDRTTGKGRIMFELFKQHFRGLRVLTHIAKRKCVQVNVTDFLGEFEIAFRLHHRYPLEIYGNNLVLDLQEGKPMREDHSSALASSALASSELSLKSA